ncbi:MAG: NUDIX hydrolase [Planctomycetota bacterium]|nr:NUDIX hydrolase [Planctomycetota bacterium]
MSYEGHERQPQGSDDGGWVRRSSRYLFDSHWYKLRQDELTLPTGEDITYTFVEHPGYAMVVALLDDRRVLMEQIYRHTLQEVALECPSGGLDGDAPEVAARRELEEETGYLAEQLVHLGVFHGSSGISNEHYHLFLASGLSAKGALARECTEQLEVVKVPLEELRTAVVSGRLRDGPSALGIFLAWEHLRSQGKIP